MVKPDAITETAISKYGEIKTFYMDALAKDGDERSIDKVVNDINNTLRGGWELILIDRQPRSEVYLLMLGKPRQTTIANWSKGE